MAFSLTNDGYYFQGGAFFDLASTSRRIRIQSIELFVSGPGDLKISFRHGQSSGYTDAVESWTEIAQQPITNTTFTPTPIKIFFDAPIEMEYGTSIGMLVSVTDGAVFYVSYGDRPFSRRDESTIDLRISHALTSPDPFVSTSYHALNLDGLSITYSIDDPTDTPSQSPSAAPSASPSNAPSSNTSIEPSSEPSSQPT